MNLNYRDKMIMKRNLFTFSVAFTMVPLLELVEKYIFHDWNFLGFLIPLMALDTVLGFYKAYKKRNISSKIFGMVMEKILIYGSVLIVAHVLTDYEVVGERNFIMQWFDDFVYAALLVKEAISVLENIGEIQPKLLPKSILNKLKEYDVKNKITK